MPLKPKPSILSTKALPAGLLAEAARAGIHIASRNFISIQPVFSQAESALLKALISKDILAVFTSKNAVKIVGDELKRLVDISRLNWTIACLEGKMLAYVKKYLPEANDIITANNSEALAQKIITEKPGQEMHFFCGNKRREELPNLLKANGFELQEHIVYETVAKPESVKEHYDAFLFFSPSGVESFFSQNKLADNQLCFAIGATTAAALRAFTNHIITAEEHSAEAMVNTVIHYYKSEKYL